MATTNTYNFAPSAGDLVLNAFGMIQIRRPQITTEMLEDAAMCCNLVAVDFSNRNPNCWERETQTVSLLQGVPTYNLAGRTIAVAIAYIDQTAGGVVRSRVLGPLSANDYASMPVKLQQGPPTSFWFNLATPIPTVSVWPVPDANGPYLLRLDTFRQTQDVALAGGLTVDSPYRFLDAFVHGLAARLAVYYPPKLPGVAQALQAAYEAKFQLAASRDQESTPMYVRPQMSGYFR